MIEQRCVVSDAVWERLEPLLPGRAGTSGATARDNRLFLEAVLWRVRTGAPWRDLPGEFGNWNSTFRRFRRWAEAGEFGDAVTNVEAIIIGAIAGVLVVFGGLPLIRLKIDDAVDKWPVHGLCWIWVGSQPESLEVTTWSSSLSDRLRYVGRHS